MDRIVPTLWFDRQAEEAARYWCSLFDDGRVAEVSRDPEGVPDRAGEALTVDEIGGRRFRGLNGGPPFPQTEASSFAVACADQAEVDRVWEALLRDGGQESRCGWLEDRWGVSWQGVPDGLQELLGDPDPDPDPDPERSGRAVQAVLGTRKLDLAALRAAADG